MGLIDKLFGGGKKKVTREIVQTRGEHMPDLNIPIDEKFTIHFKKNGGKFLYCDDFEEISAALGNIIVENGWQDHPFFCMDSLLQQRFSNEDIAFTPNPSDSDVFLTTCEHLVAQNGAILVCSNQLKEKKLKELPLNMVVFATTSQLVDSIGEGLKVIKNKYRNQIPGNITSIKHFQLTPENKDDFLSYGSTSKNLYLLLLEDF